MRSSSTLPSSVVLPIGNVQRNRIPLTTPTDGNTSPASSGNPFSTNPSKPDGIAELERRLKWKHEQMHKSMEKLADLDDKLEERSQRVLELTR